MNDFLLIIVSVIALITIFGGTIAILYINSKSRKLNIPPNLPCVLNCNQFISDGYFTGLELEAKPVKFMDNEDRYRIKFIPTNRYFDVDKDKYIEEIKIYDFIIPAAYRVEVARGEPHKTRSTICYLPSSEYEVPKILKESELGKWMDKKISIENMKEAFVRSANEIKKAVADYLIRVDKMPEEIALSQVEDIMKNSVYKISDKEAMKEKPSDYRRFQ